MRDAKFGTKRMRGLLRAYLLGTLADSKKTLVEAQLETSEGWREALEEERRALEMLDSLPGGRPARDLTATVMARVEAEEAKRQAGPLQRGLRRQMLRYGPALVSACIVIVMGVFLLPALTRAREAARRSSAQNNLRQLGMAFKMYANEKKDGYYPPVTTYNGVWMFDLKALYPEYLPDLSVLVNPERPDAEEIRRRMNELLNQEPIDWEQITRLAAKSYAYVGWTATTESEAQLVASHRPGIEDNALGKDITGEGVFVPRVREGIERFFITDINNPAGGGFGQSEIPIMFETGYRRDRYGKRSGRNVLFMDGHVEFVPLGTRFPATRDTDTILGLPED